VSWNEAEQLILASLFVVAHIKGIGQMNPTDFMAVNASLLVSLVMLTSPMFNEPVKLFSGNFSSPSQLKFTPTPFTNPSTAKNTTPVSS